MQSQTILFPEKVGEQKADPHGQKTHDPQMGIREVLHHGNPLFHLMRKCKVGKSLDDHHHSDYTQEKTHHIPLACYAPDTRLLPRSAGYSAVNRFISFPPDT